MDVQSSSGLDIMGVKFSDSVNKMLAAKLLI